MPDRLATLLHRLTERLLGWLPIVFLIAAGPLTAFLAVAVPPGEVPDEPAHIARADSLNHGEIAGFRNQVANSGGSPDVEAAVQADDNLALVALGFLPGTPLLAKHMTLGHALQLLHFGWDTHPTTMSAPNTAVYPPSFYLPAAIAIRAARATGLGPYLAILAARLTNALIYTGLGTAALALARQGRIAMLCLLCLPMSLWLAASINPDGLIIATAALAAALLTRYSRRCWWSAATLLGLAAMAKPDLAVLAIVLPVTYPGSLGRKALGGFLLACLPAALWTAAMSVLVAVPFDRGQPGPPGPLWPGPPGPLWPGPPGPLWPDPPGPVFATTSPVDQLHVLLAKPGRLLILPYDTLIAGWPAYWREFIGVLGSLDVMLPETMYSIGAAMVILAAAAALLPERAIPPTRTACPPGIATPVILASLLAAVLMVFLLQYLSWTRVGSPLIDGIQGRYVIPIAILCLPLLRIVRSPTPWTATVTAATATIIALATLANAIALPILVLFAYYTR